MSNSARPGAFLARVADIPDNGAIVVDFAEGASLFSVLATRRGDAIAAFENRCPHARFPLERPDGRVIVIDGAVMCAGHGALFALKDGACLAGPGPGAGLTPVPVRVERGEVFLA